MKKLGQKGFALIEGLLLACLVVFISAVAIYVWHNNQHKQSKISPKSETVKTTKYEGEVFVSEEDSFRAIFPHAPTKVSRTLEVQGDTVPQRTYKDSGNDGDKYFSVSVTEYSAVGNPDDIKTRLQNSINTAAQYVSGHVVSSSYTNLGSYEAIDGVVESGVGSISGKTFTMQIRAILVGQKLYGITAISASEAEFAKFRDSFELTM
jgi:type II secretory pathway pseudopilin PulG